VARSQDKLQELAQELEHKEQIKSTVIVQDLTESKAGKLLYETLVSKGCQIDLLINNAGFGDYGNFSDRPLDKQINMIQLNITVLTELTGLFLPEMKQRGKGGIINVSSIAGFQPLPYMSVYAATKAFVLSFTEALWAENKGCGVNILALCPGPTESDFFVRAEFPSSLVKETPNSLVSAEEVVREALRALKQNKSTIITGGIGNQVIVNLPRFLPRDVLVSAVKKQFKPA
jgi:short-subunit dehydrogenase